MHVFAYLVIFQDLVNLQFDNYSVCNVINPFIWSLRRRTEAGQCAVMHWDLTIDHGMMRDSGAHQSRLGKMDMVQQRPTPVTCFSQKTSTTVRAREKKTTTLNKRFRSSSSWCSGERRVDEAQPRPFQHWREKCGEALMSQPSWAAGIALWISPDL